MALTLNAARESVLHKLQAELFGPAGSPDEVVTGRPYWRYLCGMLFPNNLSPDKLGEEDEVEAAGAGEDDQPDTSVSLAYEALPSSMGISFFVAGSKELSFDIEGARYELRDKAKDEWKRVELGSASVPTQVTVKVPGNRKRTTRQERIWQERAQISVLFRPIADGFLVTASLVNSQTATGSQVGQQIDRMLFQCRFRVSVGSGRIGNFPVTRRFAQHDEDEELAVIYGRRSTHGIGHGCAATWNHTKDTLTEIWASPLPSYEVRPLTNDIALPAEASKVLDLRWLASPDTSPKSLQAALLSFANAYSEWIGSQRAQSHTMRAEDKAPATRILKRQETALDRMRRGIARLASGDEDVLLAFRLAQRAMLTQFVWSARRGEPKDVGEGETSSVDIWAERTSAPTWRPFQLAFQLIVLESLIDPTCEERDTLDLLWFPTGGGKTEAYLALVAFEIALRRRRFPNDGGGTTAFMRYTLRLLTSQQFERAATLISVLETLRKSEPILGLGQEAIRLGLWVGAGTTPNRLDSDSEQSPGARQLLEKILEDQTPENPFHLRVCPYCGTRIVPREKSDSSAYGFAITATAFRMFCPDSNCILHDEIPVSVVDDDLVNRPPTLLIATIDKFARMVWDAGTWTFFGAGRNRPPSLIIQDELHLITGPLGTIAGIYEAGIETVIRHYGPRPKYLAATATIQRASEQSKALYGRPAAVFPPPGLDASDSFFSREDTAGPGRAFVGVMGHGLYSSLTSLIQVSAAAAAAPMSLPTEPPVLRDSYWTQVVYHNSRQELGKTTTMLRDDVRSRLSILDPFGANARAFESIEELSATLKGAAISHALERMHVEYPSPNVIDAVACTNMISVGIDVSRLGLMIIKGQPKSTSEYIQASSRVGRDARRPPGVVLCLYSAMRPRDRSHYEGFQAYHQALYRVVEPATVTPFSPPARERALHAAIILALRHSLGWIEPRAAGDFKPTTQAQSAVLDSLRDRLLSACLDDERAETIAHFDQLVAAWVGFTAAPPPPLSFSDMPQFQALLAQFPSDGQRQTGHWPTLNSMRHVDGEVDFQVRGGANS